MTARPLASLSLDLDNLWSYLKVSGDPSWSSRPSYLDAFTPVMLEFLERRGLRITCFIVGADAAIAANGPSLRSIVSAGHEVGNHSFEHEPWLRRYSRDLLGREIQSASDAIADATGRRPAGFRGPGFSWSPTLLELLSEQGYDYDASTLPSYLGPIARAFYFSSAGKLSAEEREQRKDLFGHFSDGLRPVRPFYWQLSGGRQLLEIPVTTIPVFKTPFHFSYLAFLARYSEQLMFTYLRVALGMCRLTGTEPSFLLHPLDLIGGDKAPQLAFFPGMEISSARKAELLGKVLAMIERHFEMVPMGVHAAACFGREGMGMRVAV